MSLGPWAVFVEGHTDKALVESLIRFQSLPEYKVHGIGGGVGRPPRAAANIRREYYAGRRIAIILDADQDSAGRRREVQREITSCSLPVTMSQVFLLPDNNRAGNLETLLEELAVAKHRTIFECLDTYKDCVGQASRGYSLPGGKGRIYAYCEALGVEPRGTHRVCEDP